MMMFVINNVDNSQTNFSICCINMRHKNELHIPVVKYSSIQIGVIFSFIKIFNTLLASTFKLQKDKLIFRPAFRKYLVMHAFYSIEEFLSKRWCLVTVTTELHIVLSDLQFSCFYFYDST